HSAAGPGLLAASASARSISTYVSSTARRAAWVEQLAASVGQPGARGEQPPAAQAQAAWAEQPGARAQQPPGAQAQGQAPWAEQPGAGQPAAQAELRATWAARTQQPPGAQAQ